MNRFTEFRRHLFYVPVLHEEYMQNVGAAVGTLFLLHLILFSISSAQDKIAIAPDQDKCDPRPCGMALDTSMKACDEAPRNPDDPDPRTTYQQCVRGARVQY